MTGDLTHIDKDGNAVMVDVSAKAATERIATAKGSIVMRPETLARINAGGIKKGDVLGVARIAGIMAAKRTPELIPLCHPLALTSVTVDLVANAKRNAIDVTATVKVERPDRRGDGSAYRCIGRRPHRLRHVQGNRSRHDDLLTSASCTRVRRQVGALRGALMLSVEEARTRIVAASRRSLRKRSTSLMRWAAYWQRISSRASASRR